MLISDDKSKAIRLLNELVDEPICFCIADISSKSGNTHNDLVEESDYMTKFVENISESAPIKIESTSEGNKPKGKTKDKAKELFKNLPKDNKSTKAEVVISKALEKAFKDCKLFNKHDKGFIAFTTIKMEKEEKDKPKVDTKISLKLVEPNKRIKLIASNNALSLEKPYAFILGEAVLDSVVKIVIENEKLSVFEMEVGMLLSDISVLIVSESNIEVAKRIIEARKKSLCLSSVPLIIQAAENSESERQFLAELSGRGHYEKTEDWFSYDQFECIYLVKSSKLKELCKKLLSSLYNKNMDTLKNKEKILSRLCCLFDVNITEGKSTASTIELTLTFT